VRADVISPFSLWNHSVYNAEISENFESMNQLLLAEAALVQRGMRCYNRWRRRVWAFCGQGS
ncbi:hypothetical protein, partial [Pyramidobacter piscolens]